MGFTVFSLNNVEKPLILMCFRSKMVNDYWFYCAFAQKWWKTLGVSMFVPKHVEKPLVSPCFRPKMLYSKTIGFSLFLLKNVEQLLGGKLKNDWLSHVFAPQEPPSHQPPATDAGAGSATLAWRHYEEPYR